MAISDRLYLAAHLPFLPAERRVRAGVAPPDAPFVLIEKEGGAIRLMALSPDAARLGLAPGMMLADSRARAPELLAFPHEPEGDAALLVWLADACERYTPMVAIEGAADLLLDLTGCFASLGMDAAGVSRDLEVRLARQGLSARVARARTPDAALALARFGLADVRELPVGALGLEAGAELALRRAGLRRLADLASRPRAPLAARFGAELPTRLARLLEEEDRHITPRRHPPPVDVVRRFAEPMATVDPLLALVQELAGEAAFLMAGQGMGGRRFELRLYRTDGHVAALGVDSGSALRDPAAIRGLFHERIESLADPLDPGFGYDMMRLSVPLLEPLAARQERLDAAPDEAASLASLLDRLAVRFGVGSIACFAPRDAHLPEYAMQLKAPGEGSGAWEEPESGEPPLRPLYLFDPPERVTVLAAVPDGPPRRFQWRQAAHRIVRYEGPERIAYPWWKQAEGKGPTRDYYRVEDEEGHRFWLFRHGLYGSEKADPGWYLHGLFA